MNEEREVQVRRMLQGFEHKIVEINKRNIREITGEIGEHDFLLLAEAISVCRARYLKEVLSMTSPRNGGPKIELSDRLLEKRNAYQEAMRGFNALKHALQRGYFVLKDESAC